MRLLMTIAALCCLVGVANADVITVVPGQSIQDAIDIADPGDIIEVRKGIYVENVFIYKDDLTLKSKGAVIDGSYEAPCISVDADDVTITGFRLVNGTAGIFAADIYSLINDKDGEPPPGEAFFADDLKLFRNEVFGASPLGGILVLGNDALIEGNTVIGSSGYGIYYRANLFDPTEQPTFSRTYIRKNIVRHTKFAPLAEFEPRDENGMLPAGNGIFATGGRLDIVGNHSEGAEFAGIAVEVWPGLFEGPDDAPFTRISQNVAHYNGAENRFFFDEQPLPDPDYLREDGIWVYDDFGMGTLIDRNVTHKNGDDGIEVYGYEFTVLQNKASWNNDDGIEGTVDDSLFHKNVTSFNLDDGIVGRPPEFDAADGLYYEGNAITSNSSFANGDEGIQFSGPNNYIFQNKVTSNVQNGILVMPFYDMPPLKDWGVVIDTNQVHKNGHQGISNSVEGTEIVFNKAKGNGWGRGPDIAGHGNGDGTCDLFLGNQIDVGGPTVEDEHQDPMYDG